MSDSFGRADLDRLDPTSRFLIGLSIWDVVDIAPRLLGARLIKGDLSAQIVEVEAYRADDPGCHAFNGKTKRCATMFGPPGLAYVYFTYGNHWMLNVVGRPEGEPSAILIRAAEPLTGHDEMRSRRPKASTDRDLLSGPGKLAAAYGLTGADDGTPLFKAGRGVRIEIADRAIENVLVGPRIGLALGKGDTFPWRFVDADRLAWASRPIHSLRPR